MLTGRQKAATLLMGLDAATAAELLKGLDSEEIEDIAMEVARIDASEQRDPKEQAKVIKIIPTYPSRLAQRDTILML